MPFRGAALGTVQALGLGWLILQALQDLVADMFTRGAVPQDIAGPIGIVDQANSSEIFTQGPLALLSFAGMLSINLAVMNVLPIPALDGGRALFIVLEKLIGKKAIQKVEAVANYGGFIFLIGLIVIISARDVFRIVIRAL
jgi:regulator of sigma E protease